MPLTWDPKARFEYVPVDYREGPEAERPVFYIRPLKARERAQVMDSMAEGKLVDGVDGGGPQVSFQLKVTGTFAYEVLRRSLDGWKNVPDLDFKRGQDGLVLEELLDRIHPEIRTEVATKSLEYNEITERDEKNS